MTNPPAPPSPLAFTRAYQRYRADAALTPFPDSRLLLAARFWTANAAALGADTYAAFWREDIPAVLTDIGLVVIDDLKPAENEEIGTFLDLLSQAGIAVSNNAAARGWESAARQWLYIGEANRALDALARARIAAANPAAPLLPNDLDAEDIPVYLGALFAESDPGLARWLREFDADCHARRETGDPHRAHCLVVEYDADGRPVRGRLRTLEGEIEPLKTAGRAATLDEVIFHQQIRSPDDPFVGTVYGALSALRTLVNSRSPRTSTPHCHPESASTDEGPASPARTSRKTTGPSFRARFRFTPPSNTGEIYTGNSIGLAALAVAYGAWRARDIHRERRLISDAIAFTGGLTADGDIQRVSPGSLAHKIERAFHSPLTHVAVPEANRRAAEAIADRLRAAHPRRRLRIIGLERPADLITDLNIFRTEKVCLGEFAARKAARWGRSVKVQAPVLGLLGYLLLCLLFPSAWIFFDDNPDSVRVRPSGPEVYNRSGNLLWRAELPCECDTQESRWAIADLSGDGLNEIVFQPDVNGPCSLRGAFLVYGYSGGVLFERQGVILDRYPGDSSLDDPTRAGGARVFFTGDDTLIVSVITREYPARAHITIWGASGQSLGWYINSGYVGLSLSVLYDTNGSAVLLLPGTNNRLRSAILLGIPLIGARGVSPPYLDDAIDLASVTRGNQMHYLMMPPTDLNRALNHQYNTTVRVLIEGEGGIRVDVREALEAAERYAFVSYIFTRDFRLDRVLLGDSFLESRRRLILEGRLEDRPLSHLTRELAASVKYWADPGWVSEE